MSDFPKDFRPLACRTLQAYVKAFRQQVPAVREAKDDEAVHDLRVASRRLRSALSLFEPCIGRQAREWSTAIRKVTRRLGAARDLDVQIEFVREFLATLKKPAARPGLERLLRHLRQRRKEAQRGVEKVLCKTAGAGVLRDMGCTLKQAGSGKVRRGCDGLPASVRKMLRSLLKDMLKYERFVAMPKRLEEHHRMRIAAKHLRYAMEVFRDLGAAGLDSAIEAAKAIQGKLGQLHDCDVWIKFLPRFLDRERRRLGDEAMRELEVGIEHLRLDRLRRRAAWHRQFVQYWRGLKKRRTWRDLEATLSARPAAREVAK
jgi:CHAD domain-containing protein